MLCALWLLPLAALCLLGLHLKPSASDAQVDKSFPGAIRARAAAAPLPITRVDLFSSGVAWFQRQGEVTGNARVDLSFHTREINDVLRSLVLQDLDGGQIRAASCDSHDPLARQLKSFAIDLSANPSQSQVLDQARGEEVEIQQTGATVLMTGTIMGVEKQKRPAAKEPAAEVEMLNLWCATGMRSVKLADVQRIRFLNPVVEGEVKRALNLLASGHDKQKKTISLNFTGKGKRKVRIGYLVEFPLWKTSYRLEAGKDGKQTLQGWAFVANPSDEDWTGVSMRLVSGRPISFRMEMYQPLYVQRPLVELDHFGNLRPQVHDGDLSEKPAGERLAPRESSAGKAAPDDISLKGGPEAAIGGRVGDLFHYVVKDPVTLPRQKSALIPIINQPIEGKKVSIFNEKTNPKFPLLALHLENTTGLHLMQGPITVLEGSYAGDARLLDLRPNEQRLISYAVDLGVEVESAAQERKDEPERLVSVRIDKGLLQATHVIRETRVYTVKNRAEEERQVIVEHPIREGVKLIRPEQAKQRTRSAYRFTLTAPKGKTVGLTVVEERDRRAQLVLTNANDASLQIYLTSKVISPKAKAALQKASEMKSKVESARREAANNALELKDLIDDQVRIRANMARVPETSDAYKRYLKKLEEQEKEIETLQAQGKKLRAVEQHRRQEYEAYLSNLTVD